jgi:hypothetical protein
MHLIILLVHVNWDWCRPAIFLGNFFDHKFSLLVFWLNCSVGILD